MTEEKNEKCCNTKSCCGKKAVVAILLAVLLFGSGYGLGKSGLCASKTCPVHQVQQK